MIRFAFASLVLSSTGAGLILWIRLTFCAQMAFLTALPTKNVHVWNPTLFLMFLDVLTLTLPFLALLAFLVSFAKAVHLLPI